MATSRSFSADLLRRCCLLRNRASIALDRVDALFSEPRSSRPGTLCPWQASIFAHGRRVSASRRLSAASTPCGKAATQDRGRTLASVRADPSAWHALRRLAWSFAETVWPCVRAPSRVFGATADAAGSTCSRRIGSRLVSSAPKRSKSVANRTRACVGELGKFCRLVAVLRHARKRRELLSQETSDPRPVA